ncbi:MULTISPECIES: PQQ-binding-like beta-propeller repeat protein [unclassified Micromonospora]|uniref:outer membrane protein assembly factor BamB family protein n=1 Tax=unclassified Micromonospora TaxID=2617518 RepID=UPI00363A596C
MTLIDLGETRGDQGPEPPPRPPRAVGRPLRVALAGLLALFVLVSSAPVVRPASAVLGGRLGVQVVVIGGRAYLLDPATPGSSAPREVTAHATPARAGAAVRPLWRTPVFGSGQLTGVQEHAGLVLFTEYPDGSAAETLAVDVATGERRWQQPGHPVPTVGGGLLLIGEDIQRGELRSVDPPSGRVRWSVPSRLGRTTFHYRGEGGPADLVALVTAAGRIELRDAASGAVRAGLAAPPGGWQGGLQVDIAGDLLLAFEHDQREVRRVTAYGLGALDRRWALEQPQFGYAVGCGGVLCASAYRGAGLSGLDPATGEVRWTVPRWQTVVAVRGDRLLAIADDQAGGTASHLGVLDAATGREVADLGRWDLAFSRTPGGPSYGTRPDRDGRGLVVAELDLAGATVRLRDVLPGAAGDCAADGRDIVCRRESGTYGWWRLPA